MLYFSASKGRNETVLPNYYHYGLILFWFFLKKKSVYWGTSSAHKLPIQEWLQESICRVIQLHTPWLSFAGSTVTVSALGTRLLLIRARTDVSSSSQTTLPGERSETYKLSWSWDSKWEWEFLFVKLTGCVIDPFDVCWRILFKILKYFLGAHVIHTHHIDSL